MDVSLQPDTLDLLMPMHLLVNRTGHITHAGPTITKMNGGNPVVGSRLLEFLEIHRPGGITGIPKLRACSGVRLHLGMRQNADGKLKGLAVPYGENGDILLNLSFGISVAEAVHDFELTNEDFAATDLAVEMLFLVEAKSAVLEELRNLNGRLHGEKLVAEEQAFSDTLTGLRNRRALGEILGKYIEQEERFGLMHIDLDYFKDVNDTLGHAAGDHVLQHVAGVLVSATRADDTVVRAGGDEFVILFPKLTCERRLNEIAVRIIELLELPTEFEGAPCRVSASVGTTTSDLYSQVNAERMLADADTALYASKRQGRARATMFTQHLTQGDGDPVPPTTTHH